ncbi:hypothetical protein [Butyricimonas muris]|uniref:hypothetical protein n=1 Tax=Butyricimonas muris TaxID=3378067 RepID=UPI003966C095
MDYYKSEIAYLVSLIMQLKACAPQSVIDRLGIQKAEKYLDRPEIADWDWEDETSENQFLFLTFLQVNICICEMALEQFKEK